MRSTRATRWRRLIGVYDTNGGLVGELAYLTGRLLGVAHCALCEITHDASGEKPVFQATRRSIGVPLEMTHRNQVSREVRTLVEGRTPVRRGRDRRGLRDAARTRRARGVPRRRAVSRGGAAPDGRRGGTARRASASRGVTSGSAMAFEKVSLVNRDGHRLAGRLDLPPDGKPVAYALFAHCFTCTKNLKAVGHISRALTQQGIAVLRFDFTGLGESEGDFADTNFSSNVEDLVEMAGLLTREREAPRILIGHSLGGAAVIRAAARIDSVRAVATIGAPHDPRHVAHVFGESLATIEESGEARVTLAGRPFRIRKQLLDDLAEAGLDEALRGLGRALLVMHSPVDRVVGIENAARIFQAARHPKSFVSLDRADHLLSDEADSLYAGAVLGTWARKYLDVPREDREAVAGEGEVVASLTSGDVFRTEILAGGHPLLADEPRAAGGTNAGPSPYELLAAALGACTAMTLRLYAERKGWPLERTVVRLKHSKDHAQDCAGCERGAGAGIDVIERELELRGPLDAAQRQRLVEIAERCPVHRTLTGGRIQVATRLHPLARSA